MFPKKFEPALFVFILSGLMSLVVSGISTFKVAGAAAGFLGLWGGAWIAAWVVAFPVALMVVPLTRRVVRRLVGNEAETSQRT